jgi:hypothetical protein
VKPSALLSLLILLASVAGAAEPSLLRAVPVTEGRLGEASADQRSCQIPRAIPIEESILGGLRPIIGKSSRENCTNGIDDDLDGFVDCADRKDCADGMEGPTLDILATQCCDGKAMSKLEFTTVRHCGQCGNACVYPERTGSVRLVRVGSCELRNGSRACVPPRSMSEDPVELDPGQFDRAVCFTEAQPTIEKVLERFEDLNPNVPLAGGSLSLSVDGKCVGFSFKKQF